MKKTPNKNKIELGVVLSLFDGISCGQLALLRAGIGYKYYIASEIDKYAIHITQKNFPDTVQVGDVTTLHSTDLPKVDLLIGGSPCQGFSFAGKQLNFDDPRSKLFFEFVRLKNELKPKYFLLENVIMKKEFQHVISEHLGVEPILINSNLVSAQNRRRLYWTNIPNIEQPKDKGIVFDDIREFSVAGNFYYSNKALDWIESRVNNFGKKLFLPAKNKIQVIEATFYKGWSNQRFFGINDVNGLRFITPLECERAQTIPDNYTAGISNTQRYKAIGNGWTVDIIAHIFKNIK